MLKGYRSYICSFVGMAVVLAMALGYINDGVGLAVLGFLGFGSVAALRSALTNEVEAAVGKHS